MVNRLYLIIVILFSLELGLFLVLLPWSTFWERNYFLYRYPVLEPWLMNHYLRGAVSGLGFADIVVGLWQATHFRQLLAASSPPPLPQAANPRPTP